MGAPASAKRLFQGFGSLQRRIAPRGGREAVAARGSAIVTELLSELQVDPSCRRSGLPRGVASTTAGLSRGPWAFHGGGRVMHLYKV